MRQLNTGSISTLVFSLAVMMLTQNLPAAASNDAASNPSPGDGAIVAAELFTLSWTPGSQVQQADGHLVFLGTVQDQVARADYRNHPNVTVYELSEPTLTLEDLDVNTTYYWRVDQVNEQVVPGVWKGPVWNFTVKALKDGRSFQDGFDTYHNFLADGTDGSSWDGFIGKGPRQTANRIESANGKLHLQSARGRWQEGWDPLGPLLYKTVTSDFKVTVQVVDYQDTAYNNGGLMARAAKPEDAGEGEDWISLDYFPIYEGLYCRMADDGRREETCSNGQGRAADKYLQMELIGNLFFLRHSPDGIHWTELPCSPVTRNDLVNVPLQVGLFHATYTDNQGQITFDNFSLEMGERIKTARAHYPEDQQTGIPAAASLSWIPGAGALQHDVYLAASYEDVKSAQPQNAGVYRGRRDVSDLDYAFEGLEDGTTYYWRIDEVAGGKIHQGPVWSFTTYDRRVGRFDKYNSTAELNADWQAAGTARLSLSQSASSAGVKALRIDYDNRSAPFYAAAEHTFDQNQDWLNPEYGFRYLSVEFKGAPTNPDTRLSMVIEDNDWKPGRTTVEYDGDAASLQKSDWTRWDIDLQTLVKNNPAFRLNHVKKITLAVGRPGQAAGEKGTLTIGSMTINPPRRQADGAVWPRYIHPERFVTAVPYECVSVTGGLWAERMEVNRTVSLPHVWGKCEVFVKPDGTESRRLDNFKKAAGLMPGPFTGIGFNDSDVYKIIEGTAYSLHNHPDPRLEKYTDQVIDWIAGAQWEDGYLFTINSIPHSPARRWTDIAGMHELYCAGHLMEGAVAYYEATGKRQLLDTAVKLADHIDRTFGPGKKMDPPGHQEIELALMKLYRQTGNKKYMDLAKFFIDQRGRLESRDRLYGTYSQDHIPFIQQEKGVGHSVRAGYMYIAATELAMELKDEAYGNTLFRLWDNIVNTKTYITGGIGQPGGPEGFTNDYELGNNCYAETCSGIAFAMWNHRLHRMTGESRYMDIAERTLLNNMLSSLSQEGDKHFYTNPLTTNGRERWQWPGHDCACCPSSLVRTIASIGGYAYSQGDRTINVNMYLESDAEIPVPGGSVTLKQATGYPWDGDIRITVDPKTSEAFALKLRIPGWAQNRPLPGSLYRYLDENAEPIQLQLNGKSLPVEVQNGYVTIERQWKAGDTLRLVLPMKIRRVICHPKATMNAGMVTVERGPIVYCAEFKDNAIRPEALKLPDSAELKAAFEKDFFSGAVTLTSDNGLKLIPYYLYANRGSGWMRVWLPRE